MPSHALPPARGDSSEQRPVGYQVTSRYLDGYLTFVGRTDEVFKASDVEISPFELESVLMEHPAVTEAALVPAPDPVRLPVPEAYIAPGPGFEPTEQATSEVLKYAR